MDTPLPDVLEPEGFKCLRIWYPDDAGYRRAVLGAVSYLGNWFAWERDEARNGRVAAAKFREAYTLTVNDILAGLSCDDCEDNQNPPIIPPPTVIYVGGGVIEGDDDMGQVVTEVKIVDGKLRVYYGHCCYEDLTVPILLGAEEEAPSPINDPDDPNQEFFACGKVSGLVDALSDMVVTGLQYYGGPLGFNAHMRESVPSAQMTTSALYLLLFDFVTITKLVTNDDMWNADMVQKFKCRAVPTVTNEPDATAQEVQSVMNAIKAVIYEDTSPATTSDLIWAIWEQCYQVLGPGDSRMLMQLGAADEGDCSCPSDPGAATTPTASGWYLSAVQTELLQAVPQAGETQFAYYRFAKVADHDMYGLQWELEFVSGDLLNKTGRYGQASGTYDVWWYNANSDSHVPDRLYVQCAGSVFAELYPGSPAGITNLTDAGGKFSNVIGTPTVVQGDLAVGEVYAKVDLGDTAQVRLKNLRYVHNINSPSHQ